MSNVVSLEEHRARKAQEALAKSGGGATVLLGAPSGTICPHCQGVLYHAMIMPQGNEGKACRDCEIWFDGDIYR